MFHLILQLISKEIDYICSFLVHCKRLQLNSNILNLATQLNMGLIDYIGDNSKQIDSGKSALVVSYLSAFATHMH